MTGLSTFVLVGTILSYDNFLATVKFDLNPATNGESGIAILPISAIPCEVTIGKKVYVVKYKEQEIPTITCGEEKNED
jgi:hypothetical protein